MFRGGVGWGGVGILMLMHMFRCQVDDVQRRGGEMCSCTCSVDDIMWMMFRGGVGRDVDVHVHVPVMMLR